MTIGITRPGSGMAGVFPPNRSAPSPGGSARDPGSVPFYESGPFWVVVFLVVGYVLVFQTLR